MASYNLSFPYERRREPVTIAEAYALIEEAFRRGASGDEPLRTEPKGLGISSKVKRAWVVMDETRVPVELPEPHAPRGKHHKGDTEIDDGAWLDDTPYSFI